MVINVRRSKPQGDVLRFPGRKVIMPPQRSTGVPQIPPSPDKIPTPTDKLPLTAPELETSVKFNPDKSVTVGVGAKQFQLSPEEYAGLLGKGGGLVSEKVRNIQEAETIMRAESKIRKGATASEIINNLINRRAEIFSGTKELQEMAFPSTEELITKAEGGIEPLPTFQGDIRKLGEQEGNVFLKAGALPEKIVKGIGKRALRLSAEVWDVAHTAFSRKKPLAFAAAADSFNEASNIITKDIEAVKLGANPYEAIENMENAAAALARMESSAKGWAMAHLSWWIDDGINYEMEIENKKRTLERQRLLLLEAARNYRLAEARAFYGIT